MRVWSVHPRHLDRQGLASAWREGLLAQKVLTGTTRGYRNHPQLERFRALPPGPGPGLPVAPAPAGTAVSDAVDAAATDPGVHPGTAIATYLHHVAEEATARGYTFDRSKIIDRPDPDLVLEVTWGQLMHEWAHLRLKLAERSPAVLRRWADLDLPDPHPLFVVVRGGIAD